MKESQMKRYVELSAGIVPYYKKRKQYLILHYEEGHWDFPKGHVEENENEEKAAIRELEEETGIKDVEIVKGFKEKISYYFRAKYRNNELVYKEVLFFIGLVKKKSVKLSYEHIGYRWLNYKEAREALTYENSKKLLDKAEAFILNHLLN
jgi:bis(5'-nucleosidyl)-tetraphosphatase